MSAEDTEVGFRQLRNLDREIWDLGQMIERNFHAEAVEIVAEVVGCGWQYGSSCF